MFQVCLLGGGGLFWEGLWVLIDVGCFWRVSKGYKRRHMPRDAQGKDIYFRAPYFHSSLVKVLVWFNFQKKDKAVRRQPGSFFRFDYVQSEGLSYVKFICTCSRKLNSFTSSIPLI